VSVQISAQSFRLPSLLMLVVLHRALVSFRRLPVVECSQVASATSLRILLSRVQPVFAGLQFANHEFPLTLAVFSLSGNCGCPQKALTHEGARRKTLHGQASVVRLIGSRMPAKSINH
jgi:hypothetical protein